MTIIPSVLNSVRSRRNVLLEMRTAFVIGWDGRAGAREGLGVGGAHGSVLVWPFCVRRLCLVFSSDRTSAFRLSPFALFFLTTEKKTLPRMLFA